MSLGLHKTLTFPFYLWMVLVLVLLQFKEWVSNPNETTKKETQLTPKAEARFDFAIAMRCDVIQI